MTVVSKNKKIGVEKLRARSRQSRPDRRELQSNDHKSSAMVYESDFYTTRRPYRPSSTYSSVTTPRHYVVVDREARVPRRADEQYSYSYTSTTSRDSGSGLPQRSSYSTNVERRTGSGPGGYSYSSERSSNLGGPGGYSYSSTSSGRLPYGNTYRHYSYRV